MTNKQRTTVVIDALHKPVLMPPQVVQLLARPTGSARTSLPRRCLRFAGAVLEPFALAIGGYALGIVLVIVAHYIGLDPWLESMTGR